MALTRKVFGTVGFSLWQVVYHRYVSYGERNINVFADRQNGQWLPHQVNSTKRVMYVLGMTDELPPEDYRRVLSWTVPLPFYPPPPRPPFFFPFLKAPTRNRSFCACKIAAAFEERNLENEIVGCKVER